MASFFGHGNANSSAAPSLDDIMMMLHNSTDEIVEKNVLPLLKNASQNLLASSLTQGGDPLQILRPDTNTLGYLFVLNARLRHAITERLDPTFLFTMSLQFSELFQPHLVYCVPGQMIHFATSLARLSERKPGAAILPLRNTIIRWSKSEFLTPLHSILFKQCLLAKNYRAALPVLDTDITEINMSWYKPNVQDFLLHHYYGGMLYIGLKRFDRAFEMFQLCLSTPAQVCSFIQIEAFRKYALVSLLLYGRLISLHKQTSHVVLRASRSSYCTAYLDFAQAFENSSSINRVQNELAKHQDVFNKHKNLGLAKQCVQSLIKRNIQQLTRTYLTLALTDIAKSVGLCESNPSYVMDTEDAIMESSESPSTDQEIAGKIAAERLVLRMVEDGQVFAKISAKDGGMVFFHDQPDKYDSEDTMQKLDGEIRKAMLSAQSVQTFDQNIMLSKDYITKSMAAERNNAMSAGTGSSFSMANVGGSVGPAMGGAGMSGAYLDEDLYQEPSEMGGY
ncbi:hypothetical protein HK098_005613 [Nowakowskiella sp. JEL0407]|nr:hypothetical protein HK098_005613 [Nowakowskiella sp. JEL0407]